MDWFEALTGFPEGSYGETQARLIVEGSTLTSRVNGRSYAIGVLETPTLAELRERATAVAGTVAGGLTVSHVVADVGRLHRDPSNQHALFQVASQFNLLEMTGPDVSPEDGVSRYAFDRTQGPACAVAAGAATIYRNYCVPVEGASGQTRDRQIDCLADLGAALGHHGRALWTMRNGYALCTRSGLASIADRLARLDGTGRDELRGLLRIGVHRDVEVTTAAATGPLVSQAFCSALPVAYSRMPTDQWEPFARLVLEAAYEATMHAAVLNAHRTGCRVVHLTRLGGGAFGNRPAWIIDAMRRALELVRDVALDVRVVSYGGVDPQTETVERRSG